MVEDVDCLVDFGFWVAASLNFKLSGIPVLTVLVP